jgi:hypothetical protein
MWRAVLTLVALLFAAALAAVALAQAGSTPGARAAVISASGDFAGIADSREGQAIFAASGIGPGGAARGTVEIADTGSVSIELTLSSHDVLDVPGPGGGRLSAALTLTVTDITEPAAPVGVYTGPLDSMPARPAGKVEPGATRTYEFVAALPAGAAAVDQNAVQGASVSVAYRWTATEAQEEAEPASRGRRPSGSPWRGPPSGCRAASSWSGLVATPPVGSSSRAASGRAPAPAAAAPKSASARRAATAPGPRS